MPLPTTFDTTVSPATGAQLDACLNVAALLGTLPCTVSGTNALTLTQQSTNPTVAAYANYYRFSCVAANDNTGAVTALVGALSALNVYKDSLNGPAALSGGEIQAGSLIILTYDSVLNSGSGGFHLQTGSSALKGQTINPGAIVLGGASGTLSSFAGVMSAMITRTASLAFSVAAANSSTDVTATLTGVAVGDYIMVSPPSVAMVAGVGYSGWISAAGTISVRQLNASAATVGTINATFGLTAIRIA